MEDKKPEDKSLDSYVDNSRKASSKYAPLEETETNHVAKKQRTEPSIALKYSRFSNMNFSTIQLNSNVTCLARSPHRDMIITGHFNGEVTFWSRQDRDGDETNKDPLKITKKFLTHPDRSISAISVSSQCMKAATFAKGDSMIKVFDLLTLDMIQVIKLDFVPSTASPQSSCWFENEGKFYLVVSKEDSSSIYIVDLESDLVSEIKPIHREPILSLKFNSKYNCILSSDTRGMLELWSPVTFQLPNNLNFKYKSETDLFYFAKKKSPVTNIEWTTDQEGFVCRSPKAETIMKFDLKTGKCVSSYDLLRNETNNLSELNKHADKFALEELKQRNSDFDASGKFIIFSSIAGIQINDVNDGTLLKTLSPNEYSSRAISFNQVSFMENKKINSLTTDVVLSENKISNMWLSQKTMIIATASKSRELFVFQERSTNDSINEQQSHTNSKQKVASDDVFVTLHTTMGDIKLRIFDRLVPLTSKNFIGLCRSKYYNNVIFHRVIKGFMIQTGDPTGTGTGGESVWGKHFEDEFHSDLSHSSPFMLSMANTGANSNGSQFFITTDKTEWLDKKHTIFGQVEEGHDIVREIENSETDKEDRPYSQISIISTSITKN